MIYLFDETVPTNTLPEAPKCYKLNVTKGLVYRIEITFPPGSLGLAGIRVFDGGHQLWPSTPGKWFRGNNSKVEFDDLYIKDSAPFIFVIEAYNRDTKWSHVLFVKIGLVSQKVFLARFLPSYSYEYFQKMQKEIKEEQDAEAEKRRKEVLETPIFGSSEKESVSESEEAGFLEKSVHETKY